jgi:hypothetical protein
MNLEALKGEIVRYSLETGYPADDFDHLVCDCGCATFTLFSDTTHGAAVAVCSACEMNLSIYDSADFIEEAGQHVCSCDHDVLHLMVGLAHYPGTADTQWVYVGAQCTGCDLVGVFVDWEEP